MEKQGSDHGRRGRAFTWETNRVLPEARACGAPSAIGRKLRPEGMLALRGIRRRASVWRLPCVGQAARARCI